jgi:hypothetical protein
MPIHWQPVWDDDIQLWFMCVYIPTPGLQEPWVEMVLCNEPGLL